MHARVQLFLKWVFLTCLVCLTVGCAVDGEGGLFGGGVTEVDLGFGTVFFQLPEENEVVDAPFTIGASAENIAFAVFIIDSEQIAVLYDPPFELEIDPLALSKGEHRVGVAVGHPAGDERYEAVNITVVRWRPPLTEIQAAIDQLGPGEWYGIPETPMRDVDWGAGKIHGRGDITSIVGGGSGGAYDTKRDRLLVWGGGGTSTRNDLYGFDLNQAAWIRFTDPSPFAHGGETNTFGVGTHPDGAPVSRHSHDMVDYIPEPVDRMFMGSGHFTATVETKSYLFDFETATWSFGPDVTSATVGGHCGVDGTNVVWQQGAGTLPGSVLSRIDVVAHTSTDHAEYDAFYDPGATSDVDPTRNLLVAVGDGKTRVWDLDNPNDASVIWTTTGDTGVENVHGPGAVYDPSNDRIVAWAGGKDVYVLDLDTRVWTRLTGQGDVDPGPASSIFGRWRYVPSRDLFITMTSADKNVYVYRLGTLP
jgi:hypothetical protein